MTRSCWVFLVVVMAATSLSGVARAEPKVFLEIQGSTEHVRVLQRDPFGRAQPVCTGRCERSLDQGPEYLLETGRAFLPAPLSTTSRRSRCRPIAPASCST
jgi:hypothetical protein